MAQTVNEVSVDHSGRQSEEMIAKEVIVKVLVPAVFSKCDVQDGESDIVFDHWYAKLYDLLLGNAPEKEKEATPAKKVQPPVKQQDNIPASANSNNSTVVPSDKITEKQVKKIFVLARERELAKETIERHAKKAISSLTKKEASDVIDWLINYEDPNDLLYGRAG